MQRADVLLMRAREEGLTNVVLIVPIMIEGASMILSHYMRTGRARDMRARRNWSKIPISTAGIASFGIIAPIPHGAGCMVVLMSRMIIVGVSGNGKHRNIILLSLK